MLFKQFYQFVHLLSIVTCVIAQQSQSAGYSFIFSFKTDSYGEETSWNIKNEMGEVIKAGPLSEYQDSKSYTISDYLDDPNQCYTLTIYDSHGDGICCKKPWPGNYILTVEGEVVASCDCDKFKFEIEHSFGYLCPTEAPTNSPHPTPGPTASHTPTMSAFPTTDTWKPTVFDPANPFSYNRNGDDPKQRKFLEQLYKSANGDSWMTNTNWTDISLSYCWWHGVYCCETYKQLPTIISTTFTCTNEDKFNIVALELDNNRLKNGGIPTELGYLSHLQKLYLNNNDLIGTLPSSIGRLTKLTNAQFHFNKLEGTIPSHLGFLTDMDLLYLYNNDFIGKIPTELGRMTRMKVLGLSENSLTGSIPSEFGNLQMLEMIYLSDNKLTGAIPNEFQSLYYRLDGESKILFNNNLQEEDIYDTRQALIDLIGAERLMDKHRSSSYCDWTGVECCRKQIEPIDVCSNNPGGSVVELNWENLSIRGQIPSSIQVLSALKILQLGNNEITGVPLEITALPYLEKFDLSNNRLSSSLPSWNAPFVNLDTLILKNNFLTGTIPEEIKFSTLLQDLDLSNNDMTGNALEVISELSLSKLDISSNKFSGSIPTTVGQLSFITSMRMSYNQFNGTIPEYFGRCKQLRKVDLSNNLLEGEFPKGMFQLSNLEYFDLSQNKLFKGTVPYDFWDISYLRENKESLKTFETKVTYGSKEDFYDGIGMDDDMTRQSGASILNIHVGVFLTVTFCFLSVR